METEKMNNSCLAVDGERIRFHYGGRKAKPILDELNIRVERGIIYGLLGPSGCGKTTLLRCIIGRHQPINGTIKIYGKTPGQRGFCIPGPGVGFMPQELALYPEITMEETLMYFGRLYQMPFSEIKERITFLVNLLDIPDRKKLIKNLSCGQQRRVSFAAALIHKPPLLILDEPTVGVDPLLRKNIWKHLQNLATKNHLTIIVTTHYVEEARQAHIVGLMRNGRLLAETNPETLIRQHEVSTLEDVFLKLCTKDVDFVETSLNNKPSVEASFNVGDKEEPDGIWVHHNDFAAKYEPLSNNSGGRHYKVALLHDNRDGEVLDGHYSCVKGLRSSSVHMAALITKNFICLKRNIPLLFSQIFVPALMAIVFCLCMGGEPFDLPVAVVNMDTESAEFGEKFLSFVDSHFIIQKPYFNLSLALDSVKQGQTWGVVYIGPDFSDSLTERFLQGSDVQNNTIEESRIRLYLDLTNQQVAGTLYSKFMKGFQKFAESMLQDMQINTLLASPPVILEEPIYGRKQPSFTEFMAPGMILGITFLSAVGLSVLSIIGEKKTGLLDRSQVAGVSSSEVIFSNLFVLFFVMIVQSALVLLLTLLAFNIPSHGNVLWIIIATLLVGMEGMTFGLLISSICNDENTAVMLTLGSFFPNVLLSGIIWSPEAMPYYLRYLSYCLPLTLICNTMRSVLSRGWSILDNHIWDGYLVAIVWIVVPILLSSLIFKLRR